jgi:hypothetical protein
MDINVVELREQIRRHFVETMRNISEGASNHSWHITLRSGGWLRITVRDMLSNFIMFGRHGFIEEDRSRRRRDSIRVRFTATGRHILRKANIRTYAMAVESIPENEDAIIGKVIYV